MSVSHATHLSLGDVARRFGVPLWRVRRLFQRGILPEPARVGQYRAIDESDLPKIEAALRAFGYLKNTSEQV